MGLFGGSSKSVTTTTNQAIDQRRIETTDIEIDDSFNTEIDDRDTFSLDESTRDSFNTSFEDRRDQSIDDSFNTSFEDRRDQSIDDSFNTEIDDRDTFSLDESIRGSFTTDLDDGAIQAGGDVSVIGLEGDALEDLLASQENIAELNIELLDNFSARQADLAKTQIKAGSSALASAFQNTSAGLLNSTENIIKVVVGALAVVGVVRAFRGRAT